MIATAPPSPSPPIDGLRTRPWNLSASDWQDLLRRLRFQHFKWDTFACGKCLVHDEAIVLTREAHREVVRITEALHHGLQRFERRVRCDPEALRRLAIPEALFPLIAEEEHDTLQLARYDLFPTTDGRWMVSEFNEDVPGGFNEAHIPAIIGEPGDGLAWMGDLRRHFVDAFADYPTVALLYATAFSEDLQHMLVLEDWLRGEGHQTVLGSPAHLHRSWRRPSVLGTPIDAGFRFYPAEWMPRLPNLRTWNRIGRRLPMMNPVHRLVRQSKTIFALWADDRYLDPVDRELVAAHCPITLQFEFDHVEMLRDEREKWVIKRAFGRMGDSVVIGSLCTEAEWAEAIAFALKAPADHCIQERFDAAALSFRDGPMFPAIGAFLVNGRFAGYYSRAASRPLITHEAYHVATLVETA